MAWTRDELESHPSKLFFRRMGLFQGGFQLGGIRTYPICSRQILRLVPIYPLADAGNRDCTSASETSTNSCPPTGPTQQTAGTAP